jgi:uncharacterized membrane protein
VLSSPYAVIGGFRWRRLVLWHISQFSLAILKLFDYRIAGQLLLPLVGLMCLVSLWLIYLQAFVIHAFCQFCLLSAGITLTALVFVARQHAREIERSGSAKSGCAHASSRKAAANRRLATDPSAPPRIKY